MTWPATVPTDDEERPEASSETANTIPDAGGKQHALGSGKPGHKRMINGAPPEGVAENRLNQDRHEIAAYDDPREQVSEFGARLNVGGKVARVQIGYARHEGGAEKREQAPQTSTRAAVRKDSSRCRRRFSALTGLAGRGINIVHPPRTRPALAW